MGDCKVESGCRIKVESGKVKVEIKGRIKRGIGMESKQNQNRTDSAVGLEVLAAGALILA